MVSREEAEATFRALVNNAEAVAGNVAVVPAAAGWNYKIIVAIVLIVLVVLGIGGWWWFRGRKGKPGPIATPAPPRGISSRIAAPSGGSSSIPGSK